MKSAKKTITRCPWCLGSEQYITYHDTEWGVPQHDERMLFEMLTLEGAQAGLSWSTVLKKRDYYRKVFAGFEAAKVARFDRRKIEALMQNAGIVRNRLKIEGTVKNARAFLQLQKAFGSFDGYIWAFVGGKPLQYQRRSMKSVPSSTALSDLMSKDLKRRGFTFVGPTIMYAFMQATGMVNDHLRACFRHGAVAGTK